MLQHYQTNLSKYTPQPLLSTLSFVSNIQSTFYTLDPPNPMCQMLILQCIDRLSVQLYQHLANNLVVGHIVVLQAVKYSKSTRGMVERSIGVHCPIAAKS